MIHIVDLNFPPSHPTFTLYVLRQSAGCRPLTGFVPRLKPNSLVEPPLCSKPLTPLVMCNSIGQSILFSTVVCADDCYFRWVVVWAVFEGVAMLRSGTEYRLNSTMINFARQSGKPSTNR